ncbi:MAG: hypothetical protein ABW032_05275 [Burkholderiaceae bacterium]
MGLSSDGVPSPAAFNSTADIPQNHESERRDTGAPRHLQNFVAGTELERRVQSPTMRRTQGGNSQLQAAFGQRNWGITLTCIGGTLFTIGVLIAILGNVLDSLKKQGFTGVGDLLGTIIALISLLPLGHGIKNIVRGERSLNELRQAAVEEG